MGLASALSTALTGLNAAESTIDVVGNNVANANTVGFKASEAVFATQFLQTQSLGSSPTSNNGGTNPRQTGLGVLTAEVKPDFTQGTIEISTSPSDLAIQGDGFFTVQGNQGDVLYTRNGIFKTNSENQLVTTTGQRLLGFGVDEFFQVEATTLEPISIPLGAAAVAQATRNVFLEGTLTPSGDIATAAEIVQTGVLGDSQFARPTTAADSIESGASGTGALTGKYRYYVTFADASRESRPSPLSLAVNPDAQDVQLSNIPTATTPEWGAGTVRRIYRNAAGDDSSFYFLGEIADNTTTSFLDNFADAALDTNRPVDLDGPTIEENTLLVDLVQRDGDQYQNLFELGTLSFAGRKGGRTLGAKELEVTGTSTVLDLMEFMQGAMGVRTPPGGDPLNPIPTSTTASGTPVNPGASIIGGRIRIVGNNGEENAIDIGLGALQLTDLNGLKDNVELAFGSSQSAVGQGAVTDFVVYDSLGIPLNVRVTAVLQERTGTTTTYRWYADSPDNEHNPAGPGSDISVGTGLVTFDGEGNLITSTNATVTIERRDVASSSPLAFDLDFNQISGLAAENSSVSATRQDGSPPGSLASYIIGEDGRIRGVFSNGVTRDLAQIRLARFANPAGLEQRGQNLFSAGVNSGLPIEGNPGEQGIGQIIAGAVELSNTDIGQNLIDLILASTAYRGNTRVIDATQRLLDELLNLRR